MDPNSSSGMESQDVEVDRPVLEPIDENAKSLIRQISACACRIVYLTMLFLGFAQVLVPLFALETEKTMLLILIACGLVSLPASSLALCAVNRHSMTMITITLYVWIVLLALEGCAVGVAIKMNSRPSQLQEVDGSRPVTYSTQLILSLASASFCVSAMGVYTLWMLRKYFVNARSNVNDMNEHESLVLSRFPQRSNALPRILGASFDDKDSITPLPPPKRKLSIRSLFGSDVKINVADQSKSSISREDKTSIPSISAGKISQIADLSMLGPKGELVFPIDQGRDSGLAAVQGDSILSVMNKLDERSSNPQPAEPMARVDVLMRNMTPKAASVFAFPSTSPSLSSSRLNERVSESKEARERKSIGSPVIFERMSLGALPLPITASPVYSQPTTKPKSMSKSQRSFSGGDSQGKNFVLNPLEEDSPRKQRSSGSASEKRLSPRVSGESNDYGIVSEPLLRPLSASRGARDKGLPAISPLALSGEESKEEDARLGSETRRGEEVLSIQKPQMIRSVSNPVAVAQIFDQLSSEPKERRKHVRPLSASPISMSTPIVSPARARTPTIASSRRTIAQGRTPPPLPVDNFMFDVDRRVSPRDRDIPTISG